MTSEQLRAVRDATPFLPFVIHLTDGRSFPIPHRDYLSISPHGRVATVYRDDSEAFHYVDVMLITDLAMQPSPTSADSAAANGSDA